MDVCLPDKIPATRVILGHSGWLERKGDKIRSFFALKNRGLEISIFQKRGYQHWDLQSGTTTTPSALSCIILLSTLVINENGGNA